MSANSTSNATDIATVNIRVTDTTNTIQLHAHNNGNLFISTTGDGKDISNLTSTSLSGDAMTKIIIGDSSERLLHYFPDVVVSTGASRLRLATWDKLPKGAKAIMLTPIKTEDSTILLGIDLAGNYLWPFRCGIKGQLNKVFLVRDAEKGAAVLEKESMRYTVTGGVSYDCAPLDLVPQVA